MGHLFQGLVPRLLLGLCLAALLIFGLQLWVGGGPMDDRDPISPAPAPGPEDPAAGGRGVLNDLHGRAGLFFLARRQQSLPEDAAPVLTIDPGGVIRLTVPPPLRATPGPQEWPKVGVLLPRQRLIRLSPSERASLLRIWSRLAGGAWLEPRHIVACDLDYRPEELVPLLKRQAPSLKRQR